MPLPRPEELEESSQDQSAVDLDQVTNGNSNDVPQGNSLGLSDIAGGHSSGYEGFDPSIHAMNEDGTPKLKKGGGYAMKRGRKPGSQAAAPGLPRPAEPALASPAQDAPQASPAALAKAAGNTSAKMIVTVCAGLFGTEWVPPQEEGKALAQAFADYYTVRGIPTLPPELALALAVGMYAGPRLVNPGPETKAKLEAIKAKVSGRRAAREESTANQS